MCVGLYKNINRNIFPQDSFLGESCQGFLLKTEIEKDTDCRKGREKW